MEINHTSSSEVTAHRRKYDVPIWLVSMFFLGWVACTAFYSTDTWQRAKATGYFGSVPALWTLTDQLGRCEAQLGKKEVEP